MTTTIAKLRKKTTEFFSLPFFSDYRTIAILWLLLAIIAAVTKGGLDGEKMNNFQIYRQVFWHLLDFKSLYAYYPEEYHDHNLYGPVFSIIIAPFAAMPKFLGIVTWLIALGASLYAAILKLPLAKGAKIFIYWFVSNEVLGAMFMGQFNIVIAAVIIGSYAAIRHDRISLAAFLVILGTMTKLYGILGLAFIFFTKRKTRFVIWLAVWGAVMFVLPMLLSSPEYIIDQYVEWYRTILDKNDLNVAVGFNTQSNYYQNISVLGMTHRITQLSFSDLYILVPAMVIFLLPYLRVGQYRNTGFQWGIVASVLMCIILFSTGSESSGYIIAILGVALWYVTAPWKRTKWDLALLIFALILGSFGTSDLIPRFIQKSLIRPYSLKALPVLLVWLKLIWELCTRNYTIPAHSGIETNIRNSQHRTR